MESGVVTGHRSPVTGSMTAQTLLSIQVNVCTVPLLHVPLSVPVKCTVVCRTWSGGVDLGCSRDVQLSSELMRSLCTLHRLLKSTAGRLRV